MATAAVTNQFTASTTIVSDDVDTNFGDLVTFLNGSVLHLDGTKAMTGDLDMGGQDINNAPWKTWTPTFSNITVGNGAVVAKYIQIGDLVVAQFSLTFGSSTDLVGGNAILLPVTAERPFGSEGVTGFARLREQGSDIRYGPLKLVDSTHCEVRVWNSSSTYLTETAIHSTLPFTWGTSDILSFNMVYEAA